MRFRFPFTIVILGILAAFSGSKTWASSDADAPDNGTQKVDTATPLLLPGRETVASPEFREMTRLFSQGFYPEIIALTSEVLEKGTLPAPAFSYGRGCARRLMSLFDGAREDLQPLGNFSAYAN